MCSLFYPIRTCDIKLNWFEELCCLCLRSIRKTFTHQMGRLSPIAIRQIPMGLPGFDLLRAIKLPPASLRKMDTSDEALPVARRLMTALSDWKMGHGCLKGHLSSDALMMCWMCLLLERTQLQEPQISQKDKHTWNKS